MTSQWFDLTSFCVSSLRRKTYFLRLLFGFAHLFFTGSHFRICLLFLYDRNVCHWFLGWKQAEVIWWLAWKFWFSSVQPHSHFYNFLPIIWQKNLKFSRSHNFFTRILKIFLIRYFKANKKMAKFIQYHAWMLCETLLTFQQKKCSHSSPISFYNVTYNSNFLHSFRFFLGPSLLMISGFIKCLNTHAQITINIHFQGVDI